MNIYISMAILYLLLIGTFENAYLFSICFLVTMVLSGMIISLVKKYINPKFRILVSLLVTSVIVTFIELFIKNYIPGFYKDMGLYIPLIILIIYDYDSNRDFKESLKYTFNKSIRYILLLLGLVLFKEIVGTNKITIMNNISYITGYRAIYNIFPQNNLIPMPFFDGAGSFILVGLTLGIINRIKGGKNG